MMRLDQTQHLKQSQNLTLTPQMQQAIHILQLSTVDLQELINHEILENPFLDCDSTEMVPVTEEINSPFDDLGDEIYNNYWTDIKRVSPSLKNEEADNWIEETVALTITLKDHLRQQLRAKVTDKDSLTIGDYLIDLVDDDGFIKEDLHIIAKDVAYADEKILDVLKLLQTFDPYGVCARSLEESFLIQLRERGQLTEQLERLVSNLNLIMTKGLQALMKHCQMTQEELKNALDLIKQLSPKPGQEFSCESAQNLIPDLVFKCVRDEWVCDLNEAALPKIFVNSDGYHELLAKVKAAPDKAYLNERYRSARWLEKTIMNRLDTMLKVGTFILQKQKDFFEKGKSYLKPMTLKELSNALEMHESTIARTVSNKYATTPHGIIELKSLFSAVVVQESGEISNKAIQFNISTLIGAEDKKRPLSDDQLVQHLKNLGIAVARRTVTKYREAMEIPSSYDRKKQAQLMTF